MITKPSEYLESDSRFRQWGKLVTPAEVDLSQKNGFSLGGQWVKWKESVSLVPGAFLVCASEIGSQKYHSYKYRLIDGHGQRVEDDYRIAELDKALAEGRITEQQRVNAKNSVLYDFALYISLQG